MRICQAIDVHVGKDQMLDRAALGKERQNLRAPTFMIGSKLLFCFFWGSFNLEGPAC